MASKAKRILIFGYDETLCQSRAAVLRHAGYAVDYASDDASASELVDSQEYGLILLGPMVQLEPGGFIDRTRQQKPSLPAIYVPVRPPLYTPQRLIATIHDAIGKPSDPKTSPGRERFKLGSRAI